MRFYGIVAAVLLFSSTAAIAEPRYVPATGTEATYRAISTTATDDGEIGSGFVYRLKTVTSDGKKAESTLTPLALIYGCPDTNSSKDCQQARNFPNITRDQHGIVVPAPTAVADALSKIGKLTAYDFLRFDQTFPMMGAVDITEVNNPTLAPVPLFVQHTATNCNEADVARFIPLGNKQTITISCEGIYEISQSRVPAIKERKSQSQVLVELTFLRRDRIRVEAGDFAVAVLRSKGTPVNSAAPTINAEIAFDDITGLVVRYAVTADLPNSTTKGIRELIKLGP